MPYISPFYTAIQSGQSALFATDLTGAPTWTATAGTPLSGSGATFNWTTPGTFQTVRITVTNGTVTVIRDIVVVVNALGLKATSITEGLLDDKTITHRMQNGTRRGRRKSPAKRTRVVTFENYTMAEYLTVKALSDLVGKLEPWGYTDTIDSSVYAFFFDSGIAVSRRDASACSLSFSFRIREA